MENALSAFYCHEWVRMPLQTPRRPQPHTAEYSMLQKGVDLWT